MSSPHSTVDYFPITVLHIEYKLKISQINMWLWVRVSIYHTPNHWLNSVLRVDIIHSAPCSFSSALQFLRKKNLSSRNPQLRFCTKKNNGIILHNLRSWTPLTLLYSFGQWCSAWRFSVRENDRERTRERTGRYYTLHALFIMMSFCKDLLKCV